MPGVFNVLVSHRFASAQQHPVDYVRDSKVVYEKAQLFGISLDSCHLS